MIIAVALLLRLPGLGMSLWTDELSSIEQAAYGEFWTKARQYDHPPLYFWILHQAMLVSSSVYFLRALSVACGVGAVALLAFSGIGPGRPAGWLAAGLMALLPGFIVNSIEIRQYAMLSLTLAAVVVAAVAWGEGRWAPRRLVLISGALVVAVSLHLLAAFFLVAVILVMVVGGGGRRLSRIAPVLLAALPAVLAAGYWRYGFLTAADKNPADWWMPPLDFTLFWTCLAESVGWVNMLAFASAANRVVPGLGLAVVTVVVGCLSFALWVVIRQRAHRIAARLWGMALLYWVVVLVFSLVAVPIVWPRIILPGLLPAFLALGYAVTAERNARIRLFAIVALLMAMLPGLVYWHVSRRVQRHEDIHGLMTALSQAARADDVVACTPLLVTAGEYYGVLNGEHKIIAVDTARSPEDVLAEVLKAVPPGSGVVLAYRDAMGAARREQWFERLIVLLEKELPHRREFWSKHYFYGYRFARDDASFDRP